MKVTQSLLLLFLVMSSSAAYSYQISETIVGQDFYQHFNWEALGTADPTHGRVNYVDQQTSMDQNLTYASDNAFILRTDHDIVLDPNGPGRNSVRIKSNNNYGNHVVIFDLRHMPQGCGTWPAIWELGQATWPQGGEIDIVEGINDQAPNLGTLHTTDGCTMPSQRTQTGTSGSVLDCNTEINDNSGCSVHFSSENSYGPSFNSNGGGWYALERSDTAINMWFWPRGSSVPDDVQSGSSSVDPQNWDTPAANFPDTSCDLNSHFDNQNIIIDLTLCGDWAGSAYPQSCPSTCVDFVNNNPDAFVDAYFDFASVRIYT